MGVVNTLCCLTPAPDVLLVQCLDNSVYFCKGEDGSLTLPVKSRDDNKYHVVGELRLASREQMVSILKLIKPILEAVSTAKVMLITCLPRYLHQPCCGTDGHLVDLDENKLLSELSTMKRAIRSFLFSEKLKNVSIIDPTSVGAVREKSSYRDAVHLTSQEYGKLAAKVEDTLAGVVDATPSEGEEKDTPDAKRIRLISSCVPTWGGAARGWGRGRGYGGRGRGHYRPHGRRGGW